MKRLLFRREQPVQESPYGLAFDEEKGEAVIAEYASDGGFEIHRVPADERRVVNIGTSDIRTCVLGWNAHTSLAQLPVTAESTDEEILSSILEAAIGHHHHVQRGRGLGAQRGKRGGLRTHRRRVREECR